MTTNLHQIKPNNLPTAADSTTAPTAPKAEKRRYAKKQASAQPTPVTPHAPAAITVAVQSTLPPVPATQAAVSSTFSIDSLRLSTNFGERFAVKKLLVTVPVRKPNKSVFFRVRDGEKWEFLAFILENKEAGETYLLTQDVAAIVPESARPVRLYSAIDRRGNPMLIPLPLPGEDGRRNIWHDSLSQAIERAKHRWVRVIANMSAGANDVLESQAALGDPEWTEHTMNQLVEIAFRGKIVSSIDHPVIQELLGRI